MIKRGTGFTNVNKMLEANKGNRLGQTVSQGIGTQTTDVKTGIQQAQQKFDEEANKNRLDNEESKEKRAGVLGRFDQSKYQADMTKFNPSTGLSERMTAQQSDFAKRQEEMQKQNQSQSQMIADRIAADQAKKAELAASRNSLSLENYKDDTNLAGFMYNNSTAEQKLNSAQNRIRSEEKRYNASLKALTGAQKTILGASEAQAKALQDEQAQFQSQYDRKLKEEQDSFRQQQIDEQMAANLPSDQELADFAKFRTGTYKGPTELQDSGALISRAQQAEQLGGLARAGSGGQQELLRRFVGGKDYTQGERKLDATLLGQDSQGVTTAARQARGLTQDTSRANEQASNLAKEFVGRAQIFGNETRQMLDATGKPLLDQVDARVGQLGQQDTARQEATKRLQSLLAGEGDAAQLGGLTRTGIALQDAMNLGYINPEEASKLTSQGGLIERGMKAGLDINKLLSERIKQSNMVGLDRVSGATEAQRTALASLDRLSGKQDADSEFARDREFQAGKTNFDVGSLEEYIAKTEAEKGIQRPSSGGAAIQGGPNYVNQALGGKLSSLQDMASSPLQASDAVLNNPTNPFAMQGDVGAVLANSAATQLQAGANQAIGAVGATQQAQNALIENLLKLGGDSKTAQELRKAQQMYSDLQNKTLGEASVLSGDVAGGISQAGQGLSELGQGNISSGIRSLVQGFTAPAGSVAKGISNAGKAISTALGGGKTGNWATEKLRTIDATTGKKTKIGEYANRSSNDVMKQIMSQGQLARTASRGNSGHEGAKQMLKLVDYYNQALSRESQYKVSDVTKKTDIDYNDHDVTKFMDRIQASSYNYKDEVKNDPMASKNREIGVMAQDLEKSKMGKEAVHDTPKGKVVDYDNLGPKMLASIANLNDRLKNIEKK